jgi:Domain of unknown function (DUF4403)
MSKKQSTGISRCARSPLTIAVSIVILRTTTIDALADDAAPPVTRNAVTLPSTGSSIVVPGNISLADLQAAANTQVPTTLYSIDQNLDACVKVKWIKVDCHLDGSITRRAITISGSGTKINLSVPIDIKLTASGRGEIGKKIHQPASANMVANASVVFDVDENWQPIAEVTPSYNWTDPPHVWVLGFKITFADKVDPKLRDFISQFQQNMPSLMQNLKIRDLAEKYWNSAFTTIQVNEAPPVWLRLYPDSVGYGGYSIGNGALNLTFMAGGKVATTVGEKPADPSLTPLPKLQKTLPAAGFNFSIPITADYKTLHDQLASALKFGQEQTFTVQGYGTVKVTINGVTLYQTTDDSLAVGINLDALPVVNFAASKGTVWLTSKVNVNNATHTISPSNLVIYGRSGNLPFDLIVSAIQLTPLKSLAIKALTYDYSTQYNTLLAGINGAVRRQITPQLYIDGKVSDLSAANVQAGPNGLTVVVDARGVVSVHSGTVPR